MKTAKLLCKHEGEYSTTSHTPVREYKKADEHLLSEEKSVLYNSDFFLRTKVSRYRTSTHMIPEWMDCNYYLRNRCNLYFIWEVYGMEKLSETETHNMIYLMNQKGFEYVWAIGKLINTDRKKMNSTFRISLKDQIEAWLKEDPENHEWDSPLSKKQYSSYAKYCRMWEAEELSNHIYEKIRVESVDNILKDEPK